MPRFNSLWSRKDSRRPGVVRVVALVDDDVLWQSIDDHKEGTCPIASWERRYRPFTAPQGSPSTASSPAEGK